MAATRRLTFQIQTAARPAADHWSRGWRYRVRLFLPIRKAR